LRAGQCIVSFMKNWHRWAGMPYIYISEKYTHYPECKNPAHNINNHYFILRREALSDVRETRTEDMPSTVVALLYGEAKHYVLDSRYITNVDDIVMLAGLQMQIVHEYDSLKYTGYLAKSERWSYMVPPTKRKLLKPNVWIERITNSWKGLKGVTSGGARTRYRLFCSKRFVDISIMSRPGHFMFVLELIHFRDTASSPAVKSHLRADTLRCVFSITCLASDLKVLQSSIRTSPSW
jgi:hypothetical protein